MKTVEWKGITLTVVPVYASSCSLVINKERGLVCHGRRTLNQLQQRLP